MSNRVSGVVIPFPRAVRSARVRRRAAAPSRPRDGQSAAAWGTVLAWAAEVFVLAVILLAVAFNAALLLTAFGVLRF